jgi:hypothetical protein
MDESSTADMLKLGSVQKDSIHALRILESALPKALELTTFQLSRGVHVRNSENGWLTLLRDSFTISGECGAALPRSA